MVAKNQRGRRTPDHAFLMLLAILLMLAARPGRAQFNSSVEGTVKDVSGAVVPSADVTLRDTRTGVEQKFQTTDHGYFNFASLPPSTYVVTVAMSGFKTTSSAPFVVEPQRVQTVPISLEIGAPSETITVQDAAPLVQLADPNVSNTIEQKSIEELPLAGRNVLQVAAMTPGVQGIGLSGGGADLYNIDTFVGMTANGAPNSGNVYFMDGTSNLDNVSGGGARLVPSPDSVGDMHVSVNNYSAQYGRGNGVVTEINTRSGANKFHGSLFEYHEDNILTARTEFQGTLRPDGHYIPVFRRNEFGGSLGGPIWKNHTFFYFTIDQLLSTTAGAGVRNIETPDFVQWMTQNRPNSIATQLLTKERPNIGPIIGGTAKTVSSFVSNCTGTTSSGLPCSLPIIGQATNSYIVPHNGQQISIRVDQDFSKDRFYASFYRSPYTQGANNTRPAFSQVTPEAIDYGNFNYTHTFSPSILNEFAVGGTRSWFATPCGECQVPIINITSLSGFGTGFAPVVGVGNDLMVRDSVIMTHGTHNLRAGVEFYRDQDNSTLTDIGIRPTINFLSPVLFADSSPHDESYTINPVTGGIGNNNRYYRSATFGFYVQDQWKVRSNLSISPGIRWDFNTNPTEAHRQLAVLRFGTTGTLQQEIASAYVTPSPRVYSDNRIGYFAPRLAFAWDPFKNGKTAVRGGFGIFFNRSGNFVWSDVNRSNPPFLANISASIDNKTGPQPVFALCASAVFPYNCSTPTFAPGLNARGGPANALAGVGGTDASLKQAYSENWFLGIQHTLPGGFVLEADYTGANGRHLYSIFNRNRFAGDKQAHGGTLTRFNPYFSSINYADNSNSSSFNGMDVAVKKQFSHGLNLSASYDYSKTIDLMSAAPGANKGAENAAVFDANNLNAQRGRSSQDLPHKFAFNTVWQIPAPGNSHLLRSALGGWEISGQGILESGLPFTVFSSAQDYNGDGYFYDSPNGPAAGVVKGNVSRSDYLNGMYIKTSYFTAPTPGTNGNAGRNTYRGPGFAEVEGSLNKTFTTPFLFGEDARWQIRGDFFNLFNRVNLNGVDGNVDSGTFGKSTGAFQARTIQVGAKLNF